MISTASESRLQNGLIAGSILRSIPNTFRTGSAEGTTTFGYFRSIKTTNEQLIKFCGFILEKTRESMIAVSPDRQIRGNIGMDIQKTRELALGYIGAQLMAQEGVNRVITVKVEDEIKVWVIVENPSVKKTRQLCSLFAELVDRKLDQQCAFSIRIVSPNSIELKSIPSNAVEVRTK